MRPSLDEFMMGLAMLASQRTTCIRRGVGCVLSNARGHVLAIGYNGVAAQLSHCNQPTGFNFEYANGVYKRRPLTEQSTSQHSVFGNACHGHDLPPGQDFCEAVHAEANALLQCRDPWEIDTAYVTLSPCLPCAKLLLNTSCRRIVFAEEHIKTEAKALWQDKAGREWIFELINKPLFQNPVLK